MHSVESVDLLIFSPEQIVAEADGCEISVPSCFKNGKIVDAGPCDLRLGSIDKLPCETCGERMGCPGHPGYIQLALPVFNAAFTPQVKLLLDTVCLHCFRFKEMSGGAAASATNSVSKLKKAVKTKIRCTYCCEIFPAVFCSGPYFEISYLPQSRPVVKEHFPSYRVHRALAQINATEFRARFNASYDPPWLMFSVLPVLDNPSRPTTITGSNISIDKLSLKYEDIITKNRAVAKILGGRPVDGVDSASLTELHLQLCYLQDEVDLFYTAKHFQKSLSLKKSTANTHRDGRKGVDKGAPLHSRLGGKEGQLRDIMMGKRHDHSARSVITGDPNLDLDEIGFPRTMAEKLIRKITVNRLNIDELRTALVTGKVKRVQAQTDGRIFDFIGDIAAAAQYAPLLSIGDTAERTLVDGDIVTLNRQPSLHRPSIQSTRIKIMSGNTIRLSCLITPPFNAD